jgi:hypothetical protein
VSGFPTIQLASTGANTLTLTNASFTGGTGSSITIYGGNDGNTINAAALTGANRIIAVGGAGKDVFTGVRATTISIFRRRTSPLPTRSPAAAAPIIW